MNSKKMVKIKKVNIDKITYLIFIDVESIGSIDLPISIYPFEIGVKVVNMQTREIVYEKSFIVRKFFNNKFIMLSSFSGSKYPKYQEEIKNNPTKYFVGSVKDIAFKISQLIKKYNNALLVAHNHNFDKTACERLFDEFHIVNPFNNIDWLDSMEIAQVITNSRDYVNFCKLNRDITNSKKESMFITNSGRARITANALTCYIRNNPNYQESHTALNDIDDEIEIVFTSLDLLGNRVVKLNTSPTWRDYEN